MKMRHFATAVALILMGWGTLASAQSEQSYSDAQINAAIEIGYNDDLDRIMHSFNANVGGLWNKLNEALNTDDGQPLRAWRIHGQPPLVRVAQEAEAQRQAARASAPEMVVIPAGRFRMGCVSGRKCGSDIALFQDREQPVHEVRVGSFALSKYEVTFTDCRCSRGAAKDWR